MRVVTVRGARLFLALLLLLTFHVACFQGEVGKCMRTGFHSGVHHALQHAQDLTVIAAPIVNNFLFYFDWLKINAGFVLGSSELIIIHLLPGVAPSDFSILTCASNTMQSLRLETSESFLTPPVPSPPITMSLQDRINLVKCVLELPLPFHPSCSPLIQDLIVLCLCIFNSFLFCGRGTLEAQPLILPIVYHQIIP